jgi:hypothetical protein
MSPSTPPVRLQRRRLPHSWSCGTRGPRGRPPSPWLGRRPRRTPGGDRGYAWRCGTAGAGGPTLSRAAVLQPLPSQALLLADDTFAATDATTERHGDRQPRFAGMAMSHRTPSGRDHSSFLFLGMGQVHDCLGSSDVLVVGQIPNGPHPKRLFQGVGVVAGQAQGGQWRVDQLGELQRPRLGVRGRGGLGPVGQG